MSLTDSKIRNLKAQDKRFKLSDEKGLILLVNPNGSKYWRLKYRFASKEKQLALGIYPDVSLADAGEKRDNARKLLANGTDPGIEKQPIKRTAGSKILSAIRRIESKGNTTGRVNCRSILASPAAMKTE